MLWFNDEWRGEFNLTVSSAEELASDLPETIGEVSRLLALKETTFKAREEIDKIVQMHELELLSEQMALGKAGILNGSTADVRKQQGEVFLYKITKAKPDHPYTKAVVRKEELDHQYRQTGVDIETAQAKLSAKMTLLRLAGYKLRALGG